MERIGRALNFIIPLLESNSIPYQITGGFAVYLYGGTRDINDIDIDLPGGDIKKILPDIAPFIIEGPERYKDFTWDIDIVTIEYHGQLIDLTFAEEAYIVNHRVGKREPLLMNFDLVIKIDAFGYQLSVQRPEDLIEYKSKMVYEEPKHLGDVQVVREFLVRKS
jgi:hypothetical protein